MDISSCNNIIQKYNYFLLDLWGVVHDGSSLYKGAKGFLEELKKLGKTAIFISNAPRRSQIAKDTLLSFGIGSDLYLDVITSGEVCYKIFAEYKIHKFLSRLASNKYFYMGFHKDRHMIDEFGFSEVEDLSQSSFILCHGYFHDERDNRISEMLKQAISYKIPFICVNPDLKVIKQNGVVSKCAGEIAIEYKNLGGEVYYFGKPHSEIYDQVLQLTNQDKSKIVAVGDTFYTDILGANNFGIDSVLVTQGIFADHLNPNIDQEQFIQNCNMFIDKYQARPTYVIHNFFEFCK